MERERERKRLGKVGFRLEWPLANSSAETKVLAFLGVCVIDHVLRARPERPNAVRW